VSHWAFARVNRLKGKEIQQRIEEELQFTMIDAIWLCSAMSVKGMFCFEAGCCRMPFKQNRTARGFLT
jgi:hypothetical protein